LAVNLAYIIFAVSTVFVFWRLAARSAIALVFFGGWLLLPVGNYPPIAVDQVFPYWITGVAVPSDMLVTKAWVAPLSAFVMAGLFNASAIRAWRPCMIDLPMVLWCVWPLIAGTYAAAPNPETWIATAYVTGSWGLSWLLGRIWFSGPDGALILMKAISFAGLALVPIAFVESFNPPELYGLFYGPHPFRFDGVERYFGYRPIGFFENGNQYGIWVSLSALTSIWLAVALWRLPGGKTFALTALITTLMALASQSIGAILLMLAGLLLLFVWGQWFVMPVLIGSFFILSLAGVIHLSGVLPLDFIARETEAGRMILSFFREMGRGSFLWRLSQDFKSLGLIQSNGLLGSAQWDWWRPSNTRPWGLAILLMGQYGITGSILAFSSIFSVGWIALIRMKNARPWQLTSIPVAMAVVILLALGDALFNSFFYFPAILLAGALASGARGHLPSRHME
jgi:hypothetical protein